MLKILNNPQAVSTTNARRRFKKSERGMATIESIPVLFIMVVIFTFSLGFFGAIHTGVLNSIGSYNYALETFRFRSDLMYLRPGDRDLIHYKVSNNRVHGLLADGEQSGQTNDDKWVATRRSIAFTYDPARAEEDMEERLRNLASEADRQFSENSTSPTNIWTAGSEYTPSSNSNIQTPRIWIKTVYGICVNADCGESRN